MSSGHWISDRRRARSGSIALGIIGAHAGLIALLLRNVLTVPSIPATPIVVSVVKPNETQPQAAKLAPPELSRVHALLIPPAEFEVTSDSPSAVDGGRRRDCEPGAGLARLRGPGRRARAARDVGSGIPQTTRSALSTAVPSGARGRSGGVARDDRQRGRVVNVDISARAAIRGWMRPRAMPCRKRCSSPTWTAACRVQRPPSFQSSFRCTCRRDSGRAGRHSAPSGTKPVLRSVMRGANSGTGSSVQRHQRH